MWLYPANRGGIDGWEEHEACKQPWRNRRDHGCGSPEALRGGNEEFIPLVGIDSTVVLNGPRHRRHRQLLSQFGWVQSYGSRCVKPPILVGDISRPHAMTVDWITYAQSLTTKPMKGMLTGR
jgi:hypothetical protein